MTLDAEIRSTDTSTPLAEGSSNSIDISKAKSRAVSRVAANATNKERKKQRKEGSLITVVSPISLKFATKKKSRLLKALLRETRSCVNKYIKACWKNREAALDATTLNLVKDTKLSYRQRSNALQIALTTCSSTKKSAKALDVRPSMPKFSADAFVSMSKLIASVEKTENEQGAFDYVLRISSLEKGKLIVIPVKSHEHLNEWLTRGSLLDSFSLSETEAKLQINVALDPLKEWDGEAIGVDLGYLKLMSTDDGSFYGTSMKKIAERVRRAKPGSKGKERAIVARGNYINQKVNELPWGHISAIGVEELKGIKQGKGRKGSPKAFKSFRKKMAPWAHRQATARIEFKARLNRVQVVAVNPRNTSRECPLCGKAAKENRRGERFKCVVCNYIDDADKVGAMNILVRTRSQLGAVYGRSASVEIETGATSCTDSA
jgi:putative transposase